MGGTAKLSLSALALSAFGFMGRSVVDASSLLVDVVGMRPELVDLIQDAAAAGRDRILCDDGTRTLQFTSINDDYCDCADESDEPGTSACAGGTFYCVNAAFFPETIYSSRVHDGVCDCCDGSDEPAGACTPTCAALMGEYKMEKEKKRREQRKGYEARLELRFKGLAIKDRLLMEHDIAAGLIIENDAKVAETEREMAELSAKLDALKAEDEKKHEEDVLPEWRLANPKPDSPAANEVHDDNHGAEDVVDDPPHGDGPDAGLEGVDDLVDHDDEHDGNHLDGDRPDPVEWKEPEVEYAQETQTHMEKLEELKQKLRDEQTNQRSSQSDSDAAKKKLEKIEKYGAEWMAMDGECIKSDMRGAYEYDVCIFGNAHQKEGRSTDLGSFKGIVEENGAKYVDYQGGSKCFNGPSRSMKAHLVCGAVNELKDTEEPAKCEYEATLVTPLVCEEPEEDKDVNGTSHDEL